MMPSTLTRSSLLAAALIVALAWPAAGRADNAVSLRLSNTFIAHQGYDAVSDNDHLAQLELNYARRLYALGEGDLWAEGSYLVGSAQDSIFGGRLETHVLLQSASLGVRYTYPLLAWLIPYGRAGMGVGVGTFELTGGGRDAEASVEDRAAAFCAYMLVGVEVLLPLRRFRETGHGFTIGLVIEGGIALSTGLSFDLAPEEDEELLQIPVQATGVGRINPTGGQLRLGVVARF